MIAPTIFLAALRHERRGRDVLVDYQSRRLQGLMGRVHRRVAMFREKFDAAGVSPEDIRTAADLPGLPLATRQEYRVRPLAEVLASGTDPKSLTVFTTTGSTGEPFAVRRTRAEDFAFHIFRWRTMKSYGLRPADRMVRLETHPHRSTPASWAAAQRLGLFRQAQVNSLSPPPEITSALEALRADVVTGTGGVIARVSRDFHGGYSAGGGPRFVVTGSDLTTPAMRREIASGFGCPVHDTYGSEELGLIAWQCQVSGLYHVCDDSLVVEILRPDGSPAREGERGEVVATALHYETMPFIRYRLGDEAIAGPAPCPCGAPYSTISGILGRMTDFLLLPGGREVFADRIALVIQDRGPWVGRFELVQERMDRVDLRIIPMTPPGPEALAELRTHVSAELGPAVDFRLEIVPEIVCGPGGKCRILRSKVDSPFDRTG